MKFILHRACRCCIAIPMRDEGYSITNSRKWSGWRCDNQKNSIFTPFSPLRLYTVHTLAPVRLCAFTPLRLSVLYSDGDIRYSVFIVMQLTEVAVKLSNETESQHELVIFCCSWNRAYQLKWLAVQSLRKYQRYLVAAETGWRAALVLKIPAPYMQLRWYLTTSGMGMWSLAARQAGSSTISWYGAAGSAHRRSTRAVKSHQGHQSRAIHHLLKFQLYLYHTSCARHSLLSALSSTRPTIDSCFHTDWCL